MNREEQILKAARDYNSGITLSSPSNVIHFENGAKWADEHPVDVWHPAIEIPTKEALILYRTSLGRYDVIFQSGNKEGMWKVFVKDYGVAEWAYVNELRPKGGE